jgi:hypothetical protein
VRILLLASLAALAGCATPGPAKVPVLAPGAEDVRVGKGDADATCRDLGPIEVAHGNGCHGAGTLGSYEGVYAKLRNRAAKRGGNYVRMDQQVPPHQVTEDCYDNRFIIRGVLFSCP